ncbi:MAG: hypothetical protein IH845_05625 [Nanoarchaeota archaeon]|nr:hypothetical protein [Nanoarchaeota archaeon]
MDKRGQFYAIYIAFITLFMVFSVVAIQYSQAGKTASSLVSPRVILELDDSVEKFERGEVRLIRSSLEGAKGNFGSREFVDSFRANFLLDVGSLDLEFIFSDLTLEHREIESEARSSGREFIQNVLYPEDLIYFDAIRNGIVFGRAEIGKAFIIMARDPSDINFPVDFYYSYSREYLIREDDEGYVVLVVSPEILGYGRVA